MQNISVLQVPVVAIVSEGPSAVLVALVLGSTGCPPGKHRKLGFLMMGWSQSKGSHWGGGEESNASNMPWVAGGRPKMTGVWEEGRGAQCGLLPKINLVF